MKRINIIFLFYLSLFSCNLSSKNAKTYNAQVSHLIFSNPVLKGNFEKVFDLNDTLINVFKVLISRRDRYVRITIYTIFNKDEMAEYPSSYFVYRSKTFLCYDGSEVIDEKRVDSALMNKLCAKMSSSDLNDSRVFQFDIDYKNNFELHIPAIDPYDFGIIDNKMHTLHFPPPRTIRSR